MELGIGKEITSNPKDAANIFGEYLSTCAKRKVEHDTAHTVDNVISSLSVSSFFFIHPIEDSEIVKVIKSMNNKICSRLWLHTYQSIKVHIMWIFILIHLTYIFNFSIMNGVFPGFKICQRDTNRQTWKQTWRAEVPTNFRIKRISESLEETVCGKTEKCITKYNIISRAQYGFRPKTSTQDACADPFNQRNW